MNLFSGIFEHKGHDPGHQFFFSQKFDFINLFLKLGHSSWEEKGDQRDIMEGNRGARNCDPVSEIN